MIYLPDTNAFSSYFSGRSPALQKRFVKEMAADRLVLSTMVLAELKFGALKAEKALGETRYMEVVKAVEQSLPVESINELFADRYAEVRFDLEKRGIKIGERDQIIAAHALCLGAVIVTRNLSEFERVKGLKVENWETDRIVTKKGKA